MQINIDGLQHIGIMVRDMEESSSFYLDLGFQKVFQLHTQSEQVCFMQQKGLVIELYPACGEISDGTINHFAISIRDIDRVYKELIDSGYLAIEGEICQLPFWENGVRFFTILGPSGEKIEFCERL